MLSSRSGEHRSQSQECRRGITLVEMLVAMAITLIMMAAVVTVFDQIGRSVNDSRATVEMSSRLRAARQRLQQDLAWHTAAMFPPARPESGSGYFEYVEGPLNDVVPTNLPSGVVSGSDALIPTDGLGDFDDILMLTARSRGEPFLGRLRDPNSGEQVSVESPVAEIVWYAVENPADGSLGIPGLRTIYRRVLLVAPWLANRLPQGQQVSDFFQENDVSSHVEQGAMRHVPNTLSDLTKRENRFAHRYFVSGVPNLEAAFPYPIENGVVHNSEAFLADIRTGNGQPRNPLRPFGFGLQFGDAGKIRQGEDVVLTNVLAFDVHAYDPQAPMIATAGTIVGPGDPGWTLAGAATPVEHGHYVNLGYSSSQRVSTFSIPNEDLRPIDRIMAANDNVFSLTQGNGVGTLSSTYDTWSYHYEHDGIDQDGDGDIDEGTDGFDNDGVNGVDDPGEWETSPPYTSPLRGIEVKIRVYEPDSRQIREVTVRQSFVPE